MAISANTPGVQVELVCNGVPIHEYPDPDLDAEDGVTTRYVKARSGQHFAVRVTITERCSFLGDCILTYVYVDGSFIEGLVFKKHHQKPYERCSEGLESRDGKKLQKFQFAALETGQNKSR